jgi:CubicO group peptidase (beta-lactamase class C family)
VERVLASLENAPTGLRSVTVPIHPLPRSAAVIEAGIQEGLHLGAQLYVSHAGTLVTDEAFGQARVGVPMRRDTILIWLSSGKPISAVALAQLSEKGRLGLDDAVVQYIPEFGQGGKEPITVRQLLTHTCGIRTADKCDLGREWSEIIECICATPLEAHWVPGKRAGYHPSASWYILGELVRRVDGRAIEQYVREEIFQPLGLLDTWLALPVQQFTAYGDRLGIMYHTEKPPPAPHRKWNSEHDAALSRPGRNARGPIHELGRFYEALLQIRSRSPEAPPTVGKRSILQHRTVRELTSRQRIGMFDDTFQQPIDWGLGFAIDSKRYGREMVSYGFGRYASADAFGHGGSQSSCGFADPAHQLVVAWAFNGVPGERRHQHRAHDLNSAIYEDLQLA